jgi:polysaccharide export outer membrane protein
MRLPRLAAAFALLLLTAASGAGAQAPPASGYRIGPKDLIEVKVFEIPELNVERRVTELGALSLPLIGDVPAAGLTAAEFATRLKELLEARYVQRASVEIQVREFRSKPISVIGAVKAPGPLAFSGRWTLLEALTAAGGLDDNHGDYIYVLRHAENGLTDQVAIRVDDLMLRANARANLPIFANDVINVAPRVNVTIYCLGEVRSPGALVFSSDERITVLAAVARAGGLGERASNRILIKRTDKAAGTASQFEVNYRRIVSGKDEDIELRDGDVLVVREAFF